MAYSCCYPDTALDSLSLVRICFLSRLSCGEMAFPGKSLLYHLLPLLEAKSSLLSSFRFPPCLSESTPTFSSADIQVLTARQTGHTKGRHRNTSCDAALVLPLHRNPVTEIPELFYRSRAPESNNGHRSDGRSVLLRIIIRSQIRGYGICGALLLYLYFAQFA